MKTLKKIDNHVELLIKNRDLYLTSEDRTHESLLRLLSKDASLLGARAVEIDDFHGWSLLVTPFDWISKDEPKSNDWKRVFSRLTSLPDGGPNAIRHEIFLMVFTQNIFVRRDGYINLIKGRSPSNEEIKHLNDKFTKSNFIIGFSGINTYS